MKIGVTGRFLSGKSTFSKMLAKETGFQLFSSDAYVHDLYKKEEIRKIIVDNFGESVYKGSELQSRVLSDLVFNSEENLRRLESIIHPWVEIEVRKITGDSHTDTILEIPLLYEKNLQDLMDVCILVTSDSKICIDRAAKRGFSREDFYKRSHFQMDEQQKILNNPIIVRNDGGIQDLQNEVSRIVSLLKKKTNQQFQ